MDNKKIIGQAIKNKRIKKKKTQLQVSEDTGISRSYLSDVENGRYMPSVEMLIKLASYLELDLNFLSEMTEIQY
ncbi:helix-turn-helix transcriptional regulator [Tissierella praeacuta]|uniref:helix-turn-helix domain-containing protein n=1 Tax=Tissierella praeacuta TaxID=43131 RepID=UPI002FD9360C